MNQPDSILEFCHTQDSEPVSIRVRLEATYMEKRLPADIVLDPLNFLAPLIQQALGNYFQELKNTRSIAQTGQVNKQDFTAVEQKNE